MGNGCDLGNCWSKRQRRATKSLWDERWKSVDGWYKFWKSFKITLSAMDIMRQISDEEVIKF